MDLEWVRLEIDTPIYPTPRLGIMASKVKELGKKKLKFSTIKGYFVLCVKYSFLK